MLRRTRIGLTCSQGGASLLPRIAEICRDELGWNAARWGEEEKDYRSHWQSWHAPQYMQTADGDNPDAWNVWYRSSSDGGATWSSPVKISDAPAGAAGYVNANGFDEIYGDYGEIGINSAGQTIAVWGEGYSWNGPGGCWFNRPMLATGCQPSRARLASMTCQPTMSMATGSVAKNNPWCRHVAQVRFQQPGPPS